MAQVAQKRKGKGGNGEPSDDRVLDRFGFILNIDSKGNMQDDNDNGGGVDSKHSDKNGAVSTYIPTFAEARKNEKRNKKWNQMINSWDSVTRRRHRLIIKRLRKGLPDNVRSRVWMLLGQVRKKMDGEKKGVYQKLLAMHRADTNGDEDTGDIAGQVVDGGNIMAGSLNNGSKNDNNHKNSNNTTPTVSPRSPTNKDTSRVQHIHDVIERDIHRTYPRHTMFYDDDDDDDDQGIADSADEGTESEVVLSPLCNEDISSLMRELDGANENNNNNNNNGNKKNKMPRTTLSAETKGHAALRRILIAYSYYDPDVGYCQGMNFIAAMFLTLMSEEEAFWMLVATMQEHPCDMRGLFGEGMRETHKVLFIAEKLIYQFLPKLAKHFDKENIHVTMYATQWLLTQYTSSFKFDLVTRVWDAFLVEGWKVTYRVMLGILQHFQPSLLKMQFEEILGFFNPRELPNHVDGNVIMDTAIKIPLRKKHLKKYEKEWMQKESATPQHQN